MKTIALVNQKGGAGKSTLAASLAVAAAEAGEKVAALDLDPQGSLAAWGENRETANPVVDRVTPEQLGKLAAILSALEKQGFTIVVLDTAGADTTGGNLAMKSSDLCLVPARPSKLDLQATMTTVETVMRLGLRERFAFVLNQSPPGRNTRASEAAKGLEMFGVLASPSIMQRADHQDAVAAGQGVTEYAPTGRAAEEVRDLWRWIAKKIGKTK
jgi:chromosome partitioning protein